MLEKLAKLFDSEDKVKYDLHLAIKHLDALPILIDYIKKKSAEGDNEAFKTLDEWDNARR
jgi:hypothetical protein